MLSRQDLLAEFRVSIFDHAHGVQCYCGTQVFNSECVTKIYFLISQSKHMLWVLKRTVRDGSFEHQKHLLYDSYKRPHLIGCN